MCFTEFCKFHISNHTPKEQNEQNAQSAEWKKAVEWNATFCNPLTQSEMEELILAANYLNAEELLTAVCKEATSRLRGKSTEEICKIYRIECDMTPEEQQKALKQLEEMSQTPDPIVPVATDEPNAKRAKIEKTSNTTEAKQEKTEENEQNDDTIVED